MTILLISLRTDRPDLQPGHVVSVLPDTEPISDKCRHRFGVVRSDLDYAAAQSTYLKHGATDAALAAMADAVALLDAARTSGKGIDAAEAAIRSAQATIDAAPRRAVRVDPAKLPEAVVKGIQARWDLLNSARADAEAAKDAAARDFMADLLGRPLTADEAQKGAAQWRDLLSADAMLIAAQPAPDIIAVIVKEKALAVADARVDDLDAAVRGAEKVVEDAAVTEHVPDEVVMDDAALSAATVPYG